MLNLLSVLLIQCKSGSVLILFFLIIFKSIEIVQGLKILPGMRLTLVNSILALHTVSEQY